MASTLIVSAVNRRRLQRAYVWLEARKPAEEVLIIGSKLDSANELVRGVANNKGAALGWHRLTLPQLAAAIARPVLAGRGVVPLSRIGSHAIAVRLLHQLKQQDELGRYEVVAGTPDSPLPWPG